MRLLTYLQSLATDYSPRVHANGFLQIDISEAVRLHLWGDARIPRQKVPTPLHDHAFHFRSRILIGALNDRTYSIHPVAPEATFAPEQKIFQPHRAQVTRGDNTALLPHGDPVVAVLERSVMWAPIRWDLPGVLGEGLVEDGFSDQYDMAAGEFHESIPLMPSISVIIKNGRTLTQGGHSPTVLVPIGQTPSNEFDRHAALGFGETWQIIADLIALDPEAVAAGIAWALSEERRYGKQLLSA